jgi:hypothetical protein
VIESKALVDYAKCVSRLKGEVSVVVGASFIGFTVKITRLCFSLLLQKNEASDLKPDQLKTLVRYVDNLKLKFGA